MITDAQHELLKDIINNTERPDKITVRLDPVSRTMTVEYDDLDDEWFRVFLLWKGETMNTPYKWTDRRCQELFDLETLLREVGKINNASHAIERIQACIEFAKNQAFIELAEKLSNHSFSENETSFLGFLNGLAIADRIAQQSATRFNAEK